MRRRSNRGGRGGLRRPLYVGSAIGRLLHLGARKGLSPSVYTTDVAAANAASGGTAPAAAPRAPALRRRDTRGGAERRILACAGSAERLGPDDECGTGLSPSRTAPIRSAEPVGPTPAFDLSGRPEAAARMRARRGPARPRRGLPPLQKHRSHSALCKDNSKVKTTFFVTPVPLPRDAARRGPPGRRLLMRRGDARMRSHLRRRRARPKPPLTRAAFRPT